MKWVQGMVDEGFSIDLREFVLAGISSKYETWQSKPSGKHARCDRFPLRM